jgi:5-methylcytosine-specific restriction endonuclease McrA
VLVRACIVRGCKETTTGTRCPEHQRAFERRRRQSGLPMGRRGSDWEWVKARTRALARDSYTCRECERTEREVRLAGGHLEVHHVDGNPQNNDLSNLLTLCSLGCHRAADTMIRIERRRKAHAR